MGRQAYPIIGGIIGAVVTWWAGGTGYAAGYAIGAAIGGIVGSYADPLIIQGNKIGDNSTQTASEGGARAIMLGRCCVRATCVIARGNRTITQSQTGGKGSSDDGSTVNENVTWTFAIGLGEPIIGKSLVRIWQDETLVYDLVSGAVSSADNSVFARKFRFYEGNDSQLPDPDLQVFLGDDTPYFRGTSYVVFPNFDLTNTAERIPAFRFEVADISMDGIEDEIETLHWDLPELTAPGYTDQVTIGGSRQNVYSISLFISGDFETRYYDVAERLGGKGRFVKGSTAVPPDPADSSFNAYFIETYNIVSGEHEQWWLNSYLPTEDKPTRFQPNGSDAYRLDIELPGDGSIVYFGALTFDGSQSYAPQGGTCKAHITRVTNTVVYGTKQPLSDFVTNLMARVGIDADEYDVTALDDQVAGVCIEVTATGQDAVNSIVQPYFADPTEIDGVLTWVKRGGSVVRTLTIDDLTEEPESMSRENAIEYPAKLHFFYQSPVTGYASTKATSYRYSPQADSSGEGSVTAPVTFYDADEPMQISQKLHKVLWTEAEGTFMWKVGDHNMDLVATDVVGLFLRGIATRARVVGTEYDGQAVTLSMVKDRQSSYTSNVTGIPLPVPTPPTGSLNSYSALAVMDVSALQDTDDVLCYYVAISGQTAQWQGAQLQRSLDGGANWASIGDVRTAATMGLLTEPMASHTAEFTDTTNSIVVQLFDTSRDLLSLSDTTFLQEQGAVAIIKPDGTYEILQYRDAVDNGDGSFTLSHLQRGRLNSKPSSHTIGSTFVVLGAGLMRIDAQTAWLNGTLMHRAVSFGTDAESADVISTVFVGRSQQEWSPDNAVAEFDGMNTLYVHDIVGRDRFGTEVNPVRSANFNGYRVKVNGFGGAYVSASVLGDSAHIDVTSLGGTIVSVEISAVNKITGPSAAITIFPTIVLAGSLTPEAIINAGGGA